MSKAVKPDHEFNKELFKELLVKAQGGRTQTQFANDCGLSVNYMCRCLNGSYRNSPIPSTIKKIAEHASNSVSFIDLLEAAGYDSQKYKGMTSIETSSFSFSKYKKIALASLTTALISKKINWSSLDIDGHPNFDFAIQLHSDLISDWYFSFIPAGLDDNSLKNKLLENTVLERLALYYFGFLTLKTHRAKFSIVTASREVFEIISKYSLPNVASYVSVILIDSNNIGVIEERYISSSLEISEVLKSSFSLT